MEKGDRGLWAGSKRNPNSSGRSNGGDPGRRPGLLTPIINMSLAPKPAVLPPNPKTSNLLKGTSPQAHGPHDTSKWKVEKGSSPGTSPESGLEDGTGAGGQSPQTVSLPEPSGNDKRRVIPRSRVLSPVPLNQAPGPKSSEAGTDSGPRTPRTFPSLVLGNNISGGRSALQPAQRIQPLSRRKSGESSGLTSPAQRNLRVFRPGPEALRTTAHYGTNSVTSPRSSRSGQSGSTTSRAKTPDWIRKIFQLARNGMLPELKEALMGLEPTLIRHLADGRGNTLLHAAGKGDHVSTLEWLISVLSPHGLSEPALKDQNGAGRNVILTALKGGRLDAFEWLVLNTDCGQRALAPKEGQRSLLHFAAQYGNEAAVRWLVSELHKRQIVAEVRDSAGLTPLHLAAKFGHVSAAHELISAGANPSCQTELGWRPSDLALRSRHRECANYLMMAEAAGSLGNELGAASQELNVLRRYHQLLQSHFREILRVGKWLVKERGDLIKKFSGPGSPSKSSPEAPLLLSAGGAGSNGIRFSEMEHQLQRGEQVWKRLEAAAGEPHSWPGPSTTNGDPASSHLPNGTNSADILRARLREAASRWDSSSELIGLTFSSEEEEEEESEGSGTSDESAPESLPSARPWADPPPLQRAKSATAPWLLQDDSILSALAHSPPPTKSASNMRISNLDLLRVAPSSSSLIFSEAGQSHNSSFFGSDHSNLPDQSLSDRPDSFCLSDTLVLKTEESFLPPAAVLEVIEPLQKTSKEIELTPDLIRGTAHHYPGPASGLSRAAILEEIYADIKGTHFPAVGQRVSQGPSPPTKGISDSGFESRLQPDESYSISVSPEWGGVAGSLRILPLEPLDSPPKGLPPDPPDQPPEARHLGTGNEVRRASAQPPLRQRPQAPLQKRPGKPKSRGVARPWYEIEGSDDDGGSLLRLPGPGSGDESPSEEPPAYASPDLV